MEREHLEVLLEDISGKLQLLAEGHIALVERFDGVDGRLDGIDGRLDRVESELRLTRGDVAAIAGKIGDHEQRITKLEKRRR